MSQHAGLSVTTPVQERLDCYDCISMGSESVNIQGVNNCQLLQILKTRRSSAVDGEIQVLA